MFASVFDSLFVQPIFNLLVTVYALIPGHNFGLAIIIFTILVRTLMLPLVRRQLHQSKAMRDLQPEIKRVKAAAHGDRQKESAMMMELYKEKGVNPFGTIGVLIVQLVIFIALYSGLSRVVNDPRAIYDHAYGFLQNFGWMQQVKDNIALFDESLFGFLDLTRAAIGKSGSGIYWPALALVFASTFAQYYQSKQVMPKSEDARSLRHILRDASSGKQADNTEVQAATGRVMLFILPFFIFTTTLFFASALSLYWTVGALVAIYQQGKILKQDETEMEAIADKPMNTKKGDGTRIIIDGEVIKDTTTPKTKTVAKATKTKKAKTAKSAKGKSVKRRK